MTTFTVVVEAFIDEAWTNIVRISDTPGSECRVLWPITIKRGRDDEQSRVAPTEVSFRMLDNACTLDGDNYLSPYYRKFGLATPLRVKVDGDFRADVSISESLVVPGERPGVNYLDIVATGVLHDLDTKAQPARSSAYVSITDTDNDVYRVFYAPLEEESTPDKIEVYQAKGGVVTVNEIDFGSGESASSARLLTLGTNGQLQATIPSYTSNEHKVGLLWRFPEAGLQEGNVPLRFECTGGNIEAINIRYGTPWALHVDAIVNSHIFDTAVVVDWTNWISDQQENWVSFNFTQNGADTDCLVRMVRPDGVAGVPTDTLTGVTIGRINKIYVGYYLDSSGLQVGQLVVGNDTSAFSNYDQSTSGVAKGANGYASEFADTRATRVAGENGYLLGQFVNTTNESEQMGIQPYTTAIEVINECIDTDQGLLIEHRASTALVFITRYHLYNQAPWATFDLSHLSPGFTPKYDVNKIVNDVTFSKNSGGSARVAIPDDDFWHWTTQQPPDGAGSKQGSRQANPFSDEMLPLYAAWFGHVASWRQRRFPVITMDLHRDAFSAEDRTNARGLEIGDVVRINATGGPAYIPYSEVRALIQGYTETISQTEHTIAFNATPADAYEVLQVEADGSTIVTAIDDNDTTLKVSPPDLGPSWTESNTSIPYNVQVAGQAMRVTAISTDTPTFVAAGTASSANNANVTPGIPAGMAAAGLMLCWACIRNSGTGTVGTNPTGWGTLVDFGNCRLMYKYWESGDAAPTVTFLNGVANADTFARIFGFTGLSHVIVSGTKSLPAATTSLNSSAQNMAYGAFSLPGNRTGVSLIFAWKQDDWTGVAPPSGFTEMWDASVTTGDDAGAAAYYDLTGQSEAAGALVVTGGASAISRTVALQLRPLQTMTVTRGIDGDAVAAALGSEVRGWRMGVNGL